MPGATPTKPGSATLPFFGIDVALLDGSGNVRSSARFLTVLLEFPSVWIHVLAFEPFFACFCA